MGTIPALEHMRTQHADLRARILGLQGLLAAPVLSSHRIAEIIYEQASKETT